MSYGGYYGKLDKKSIVYVLDNGIASLKDEVIGRERDLESLWFRYRKLNQVLYGQGDTLLSNTNKVRFESRLNTVLKKLEKLEGEKK
ncbi:hypothetical protein P9G40_18895 [Bacillus velezensis]|uniref:hypothetical protein n=1 Tax=Bacillus velezensis TaxID=492670 RepID=UPI0028930113|nr:hypothetical protein [Bacillus velezensis]MEC1943147.1 hypothetical protein [Bacillus velezensis]MEC2153349.1 hypothetical protein [Bacillus velezensis]MEC2157212.1 hypothetical protein [Bacillus velezensis]WNJ75457.1 hypothetical protein RNI18_00345 [Bacillus velezensis]